MNIVIITGLSGSGKSVALGALEDAGFYCIDNLPATMISALINELQVAGKNECACTIDARSAFFGAEMKNVVERLMKKTSLKCLYIDAHDDELLRRYTETRRRHPLCDAQITLKEAIILERELLEGVAQLSMRIDSTNLHPNELRKLTLDMTEFAQPKEPSIQITSFGFKNGAPPLSDFVFDARCLPNPHWIPELRSKTGMDSEIDHYFDEKPEAHEFVAEWGAILSKWAQKFFDEGRQQVTCAIGCTGGKHRSVWVAKKLTELLSIDNTVILRHRDKPNN